MKNLSYILLTIIILNGCDNPVNEKNSYDYSIEQQIGCFCPLGGVWIKVFVKADTIADAINLSNNSRLAYEQWRRYRTIKGLLEEIANIDTSRYDVIVTVDTVNNNFPSYFYFNPKPIIQDSIIVYIMDAQMSYSTKKYIKLK